MKFLLRRKDCNPDGIFSELCDESGKAIFSTLEHSYDCKPKIPDGTFTCVRSKHRLHGMTEDFETFEIMGVEGHSNLLFHWGNWNKDSEGCVLIGADRAGNMIEHSRQSFASFMAICLGASEFELTVSSQSVPL